MTETSKPQTANLKLSGSPKPRLESVCMRWKGHTPAMSARWRCRETTSCPPPLTEQYVTRPQTHHTTPCTPTLPTPCLYDDLTFLPHYSSCPEPSTLTSAPGLWNAERRQLIKSIKAHAHCINALCLHETGVVLSASWDQSVRVWDLRVGPLPQKMNSGYDAFRVKHESSHTGIPRLQTVTPR